MSVRTGNGAGKAGEEGPLVRSVARAAVTPWQDRAPEVSATSALLGPSDYRHTARKVSVEDLYPIAAARSLHFGTAIRLLLEAEKQTAAAVEALEAGESIQADDALVKFNACLPEMFACRQIGDGYGMVVAALIAAFEQHRDSPMTADEAGAVATAIRRLSSEPLMIEEAAANVVDGLEEAGLAIAIAGLDRLLEADGE